MEHGQRANGGCVQRCVFAYLPVLMNQDLTPIPSNVPDVALALQGTAHVAHPTVLWILTTCYTVLR